MILPSPLWRWAAGAALLVVTAVAGDHFGYVRGRDKVLAERSLALSAEIRDMHVAAVASQAAASAAADAISRIEVRNVTLRQQMQTRIVERPVFRDCRSGDDLRVLFNSAIPGAAASEPAGAAASGVVPAPDTPSH